MIWSKVKMSSLSERNHGKLKNELVLGLCQSVSPRVVHDGTRNVKHCIAAFKYLFNLLVNKAFVNSVRSGCPACCKVENASHLCESRVTNPDYKRSLFYSMLNGVSKGAIRELFMAVCMEYCGSPPSVCCCVLHYKCLTIWRTMMRRQFIEGTTPRGINRRLMEIIRQKVETWERMNVNRSSFALC